MARRRRLSASSSLPEAAAGAIPTSLPPELRWPFKRLDGLTQDELRESAYEIFFCACRSTPAGGARPSAAAGRGGGGAATPTRQPVPTSPTTAAGGGGGAKNMAVTSRLKRALGLRARNTRPTVGAGGRPLTSAEIMRRQMGVGEQTDGRVRKTLVRSLVGPQMSRKVDSLVLPLELLRHLKPADFSDAGEHRAWQLRQLRILEAGLVSHPSVPLDRGGNAGALRDTVRSFVLQTRPGGLDVRALSAAVTALCSRSAAVDACRWADGYPLNVHLYVTLLRAVFDARDETVVLDEVDELMELIKKTWGILGLNDTVHNLCFTWLFLEKYVVTGETEPDLLSAALAMLEQVRGGAARRLHYQADQAGGGALEAAHLRILSATLASVRSWAEHKLLDYHEEFGDDQGVASVAAMENVVSLAVVAAAMLTQDVPSSFAAAMAAVAAGGDLSPAAAGGAGPSSSFSAGEQVERYIKSSVRRAFTRLHETGTAGKMDSMIVEVDEDPCETLMYVASQTKDLARVEKEVYSRVLRRWHPCPTAVAAATLHGSFGALLKRYVSKMACDLSSESVRVLHAASKLDKWLLQMAGEDDDNDPAADQLLPPMTPYDVDSIVFGLVRGWMDERLKVGDECVRRAHESETWNPRSKAEPYAQSAVDLMKLAKVTVDELLEIQVAPACKEELLQRLVDGVDHLVHQYALLLASSCGASKDSYVPPLPPLTRCNQDSKLVQLWKKAAPPCQAVGDLEALDCVRAADADVVTSSKKPRLEASRSGRRGGDHDRGDHHAAAAAAVRPATSRGTQRLYVRLNTLHYVLAVLHGIDRSLFSAPLAAPPPHRQPQQRRHHRARSSTSFDRARPALDAAVHHVSELAAYRLVFLDSAQFLHQALYQGGVAAARARPALRVMRQNLAFLCGVLTDQAQPPAVLEVMKASVEAFLTVVLAGGGGRAFARADHAAVAEDFAGLKRLFGGFGAAAEEAVEREAARAEGVLALMAVPTEKLIHEFLAHYAASAPMAAAAADELVPPRLPMTMPVTPATRRWSRSDADTVLRVLCHRDDEAANRFLKKAFDLPKRR